MGAVLECRRENCAGELAPTRDTEKVNSPITGFFCKRCGVTYEAVAQPKGNRRVAPDPKPGEITGRIDDFEASERQKFVATIEKQGRQLAEIDDLTRDAEAGLGKAIQNILNPGEVTEEVPDEEVAAE